MLHFKPRCSLKEGFHDFYLYNHSLLALSESQHFAVVTKPVATSKKTFSLGKYLEFCYSLQVPGRGPTFKKSLF